MDPQGRSRQARPGRRPDQALGNLHPEIRQLTATLMKLVCTTPFHPCLSEAVDLRGAARKLLFVYGVEFAALLGIGGGSTISLAPLCGTT
jgi:hypothetical protein